MAAEPAISIGVPVYNGAAHLAQALQSLLSQSFGDFEIIISDNCSSDST
ncbi:MAG TPA: glycosyltransferase family 2 protein, partial [Alphaproteobacteria bacterium]|nr:glycosyltransferase family 2 protein [Alphaproteobacteria bacterium]